MKRTKQEINAYYKDGEKVISERREMTCINELGIMQERGNKYYTVTLVKGQHEGEKICTAGCFYDAVCFSKLLTEHAANVYELIEENKLKELFNACQEAAFNTFLQYGAVVGLTI